MQAADIEGAEALPGTATEAQLQRCFGHALVAMRAGHRTGQAGADAAVGVVDQEAVFATALVLDGRGQQAIHLRGQAVRRFVQALRGAVAAFVTGIGQQARQVHAHAIARRGLDLPQQVGAADDFLQRTRTQVRQPAAHFLGQQAEEVFHALGLAGEVVLAQAVILGGHAARSSARCRSRSCPRPAARP
ncbi:hypothetical protein G6F32_014220 [Rhizopus arrhizus]|nr:hypothetical protein G6F32_014220 [Rhizopus arrhizus]